MPPIRTCIFFLLSMAGLGACNQSEQWLEHDAATPKLPVFPLPAPGLDIANREFDDAGNRLGINLPPVFSWSNTPMYADLMHQARRFGTPATPWDERALLGEDGWPRGDFGIFLMSSQQGLSSNGGVYTIRFKGSAKVQLVASPGTLGPSHYDPVSNTTTIALTLPHHAEQLALSFTQTGKPVRDLQVLRPGYDAANPPLFTREFLAHINRFKVVRLMDWLRTNNNPIARWSERATDSTIHYASEKGIPWEHAIELARIGNKDLWINIPARADNSYVLSLARLLRDQLPPERKIYVEYSNEVWNSMFSQSRENRAAAEQEVASLPGSRLAYDGHDRHDMWPYRRIAQRGKEISDLFRQVFGDGAMMTRVRPVYAIQIVNTYITTQVLDYMAKVHGPPNRYFYAIAGAPYFNMGEAQRREGLSTDQVLTAMRGSVDAMPQISKLEQNLALAYWYQMPLLAYEGGADTFGPGSLASKKAAALDPRMENLCRRHLANWYGSGGGLFMWFHAGAGKWDTPYGTWELTTDLAITDTPKIRCMHATLDADRPALRSRHAIPGRVDARAYAGSAPAAVGQGMPGLRTPRPGHHVDYLIQAPASGTYQLRLLANAQGLNNWLTVATGHGSLAGTIRLPETDTDAPASSPALAIWLRQGLNTLRLTTIETDSGFQLRQLDIRRQ